MPCPILSAVKFKGGLKPNEEASHIAVHFLDGDILGSAGICAGRWQPGSGCRWSGPRRQAQEGKETQEQEEEEHRSNGALGRRSSQAVSSSFNASSPEGFDFRRFCRQNLRRPGGFCF